MTEVFLLSKSFQDLPSAKMTEVSPPTKCLQGLPAELLVEIFKHAAISSDPILIKITTKPGWHINSDRNSMIPKWDVSSEKVLVGDLHLVCVSYVLRFLLKSCLHIAEKIPLHSIDMESAR